jgi:hypothetical protein
VTLDPRVNPIKYQNLLIMMPVCHLSFKTVYIMAHRHILDNKEGQTKTIAPPPLHQDGMMGHHLAVFAA